MDEPEPTLEAADSPTSANNSLNGDDQTEELIEGELLVEEISIDGMCGVY